DDPRLHPGLREWSRLHLPPEERGAPREGREDRVRRLRRQRALAPAAATSDGGRFLLGPLSGAIRTDVSGGGAAARGGSPRLGAVAVTVPEREDPPLAIAMVHHANQHIIT